MPIDLDTACKIEDAQDFANPRIRELHESFMEFKGEVCGELSRLDAEIAKLNARLDGLLPLKVIHTVQHLD
jgi:hypothetical protein